MSRRTSIADQVYRRLRTAITDQRLEPGLPLGENDVARAMGVSRTPIREALSRLELEGFAARDESGRLTVVRVTAEQVADLFDLRSLLEPYAAELAAERISDQELAALDREITADTAALERGDIEALAELNQRIHDIVLTASRNRMLVELVNDLRQRLAGVAAFAVGDAAERAHFVDDHSRLAALLRAGDGVGAARLLRHHLEGARDVLLASIAEKDTDPEVDALARLLQPLPASEATRKALT
ncbi:MAG: GntR family transcriptional regulator [Nitriliruptoraceae bacterium]